MNNVDGANNVDNVEEEFKDVSNKEIVSKYAKTYIKGALYIVFAFLSIIIISLGYGFFIGLSPGAGTSYIDFNIFTSFFNN